MTKKRVFLQTFGCQMNERDSEVVTGMLLEKGYDFISSPEEADIILYNTCSVRDHAEQRVFGRLGEVKMLKRQNPNLVVGVIGCMAQEHKETFFKKTCVDLVCGPGNLVEIPSLVEQVLKNRVKQAAYDKIGTEYQLDGIRYRRPGVKTLVNIMTGCDHQCTYCIVPQVRGPEVSRPSKNILLELKELESQGFRDVMLLGQNVNSYGKKLQGEPDFAELLERINQECKIPRIRFITSHPKDTHQKLFSAMARCANVCEHLHLPVQSGSDRILKRMIREHTRQWYLERVSEYCRLLPQGSLTTDIIIGFPGETEDDFRSTLDLMREVEFDSAFIFKYSPRPGTAATRLEDNVTDEEKDRRLQEALNLQQEMTLKKNKRLVGTSLEVLFEESSKRDAGVLLGKSRTFKRVVVQAPSSLIGKTVNVRVMDTAGETLIGEMEPLGPASPKLQRGEQARGTFETRLCPSGFGEVRPTQKRFKATSRRSRRRIHPWPRPGSSA